VLERVTLKFGQITGGTALSFAPGPMTVFVGPNNSGKSTILREIGGSGANRILNKLDEITPDIDKIKQIFGPKTKHYDDGRIHISFTDPFGGSGASYTFPSSAEARELPKIYKKFISVSVRLDGVTRLTLTETIPLAGYNSSPNHVLYELFRDDEARERVRKEIASVFDLYFTIDITDLANLRVNMSRIPLPRPDIEKLITTEEAELFQNQATEISQFGDGVRAFTGIIASVLSSDYRRILIDEPEAFLHPPLVRRLGKILSQLASERQGNVFASTHSADFVMGCIQSGSLVNIVRLTYQDNIPSARILPGGELQQMMHDPLLRSTGTIGALFHRGAVVCEGHTDRVLYEEINERLLGIGEGMKDVLFLNAMNKQTIYKVISLLRKMGIPAAAVVDLDIIKDRDLSVLLKAANVPTDLAKLWSNLKNSISNKFSELNVDPKKEGLDILDKESQTVALHLLDNVAEYGVFIVPVGEVERWLPHVGATGEKTKWIVSLFGLIGTDQESQQYVRPDKGDVWDFIRRISNWVTNPDRKGMAD
jgi:ABC-type cobalamin/Fe3+-siderophores transport system ATPase subunit